MLLFIFTKETLVDAIEKERVALKKMAENVESRVPLVEETIDQVTVCHCKCFDKFDRLGLKF